MTDLATERKAADRTAAASSPVTDTAPTTPSLLGRRGGVGIWAAVGVLGALLSLYAYGRWIFSGSFESVGPIGPDDFADWHLVALRTFETLSVIVLVALVWIGLVRPWLREGHPNLYGKMILGGMVGFVLDAYLNTNEYLFAWNTHNVNTGVWARYLPFAADNAPTKFAESLLWGLPMYVYFAAFVGWMGSKGAFALHRRWPTLGRTQIYSLVYVGAFIFDFVLENIFIRTTEAYAYPQTQSSLTLWGGSKYQFPLYESFLVAFVGLAFTWLCVQSAESGGGLLPVERGLERVPARWRSTVSTFAVIGFSLLVLTLVYHLPFAWLSLSGDSIARLPSYLMPG